MGDMSNDAKSRRKDNASQVDVPYKLGDTSNMMGQKVGVPNSMTCIGRRNDIVRAKWRFSINLGDMSNDAKSNARFVRKIKGT